jgi:hypothetical protein
VGDESSLPFLILCLSGKNRALENGGRFRTLPLATVQAARALPKAFFLVNCPDPASGPGICGLQAAAAREGEARLERVCGISRGPGCCTLLLYLP